MGAAAAHLRMEEAPFQDAPAAAENLGQNGGQLLILFLANRRQVVNDCGQRGGARRSTDERLLAEQQAGGGVGAAPPRGRRTAAAKAAPNRHLVLRGGCSWAPQLAANCSVPAPSVGSRG